MITETEKRALQLAKRVFEHFTHDSLPIAKEILALEFEINQGSNGGNHIPEVTKTDSVQAATPINGSPVTKMNVDLPAGIMMEQSATVPLAMPVNSGKDSIPF